MLPNMLEVLVIAPVGILFFVVVLDFNVTCFLV